MICKETDEKDLKNFIEEKIKEIDTKIEYEKVYGNVANREKLEVKKEIYEEILMEVNVCMRYMT